MHMAIGMIRQKTELFQWLRIYEGLHKNVHSIISVNCLLDLMLLPYIFLYIICGLFGNKRTNEILTGRDFLIILLYKY